MCDKIHGSSFPDFSWDLEWLEKSLRAMVEGFDLLINVSVIDEISDVLLEVRPGEGDGNAVVCSSYASVFPDQCVMVLGDKELLKNGVVWYKDPTLEDDNVISDRVIRVVFGLLLNG